MTELPQERLIQAVRAMAVCEAALDWTVGHVRHRETFGRPLAKEMGSERAPLDGAAPERAVSLAVDVAACVPRGRWPEALDGRAREERGGMRWP